MLVEHPPPCPAGHEYVPGRVQISWRPCQCVPGRTGHRTYWCELHEAMQVVPPCSRTGVSTADELGIARPTDIKFAE